MKVQRQIDHLLAQRAAEWMETLKAGGEQERAAFAAWLRQSRVHVEHFLDLAAIDHGLRTMDPVLHPDVETLLSQASPNVVSMRADTRTAPDTARASGWRRALAAGALAAGIGAIAVAAFLLASPDEVSTAPGEQRTLTLPDGSIVMLNTLTTLRIDFSDRERCVELNDGEAVFKVAQEAGRPFIVRTPSAVIRALGTQFNVYRRPHDTVVSVLEGRVQVTAPQLMPGAARDLKAGEEVSVSERGDIKRTARADVQRAVAWRERRLTFDEAPLADMVREFNRYGGPVRLRLEGEAAERYRYGGVFDADDPESLAALLLREPDLVVKRGGKEILIKVKEPP